LQNAVTALSPLTLRNFRLFVGAAALCALNGCERKETPRLPKDETVLAKVSGKPITQYDVDQLGRRTLGELGGHGLRANAQAKLIESLIQSRAIAVAAEKELNPLEKLALQREIDSYREQLLVRRHLEKHAPPAPVTLEMVTEYYRTHPERFGGEMHRRCEIVGATRDLTPDERNTVMKALREAERQRDWGDWSRGLVKKGLPVSLTSTSDDDQLLHAKLGELLRSLKVQVPSQVTLIAGRPYVARITGEERKPARPLAEVRGEIERLLAPAQLSAALERVGKDARKAVEVEIMPGAHAALGVPSSSLPSSAPARSKP
jgi:hypothetical protein